MTITERSEESQKEVLDMELTYWKERLSDAPAVLELLSDRPRATKQTFRAAKHSFALPQRLVNSLKTISQQEDTTLFMTLLAVFQVLLFRYTGQDDVSVGTPIAGWNGAEFVNTVVLRTDLAGNPSFRELLERVREVTLGAYAHEDLPFERLVEELQSERSLSHSPLFQVMFAFQEIPEPNDEAPGMSMRREFINIETTMLDLTLFVVPQQEGLSVRLEYNTDLFDAATITRMLGHFQTLLEGIVANPEQRLSDLPLLTQAEYHQLLVEWNNTRTQYAEGTCFQQLFEAQVERTPDAVAVVFEDERLTYRALNTRANRLAHHLQSLGVGPEVLVGLCMERSVDMVVGLLGILKAGGAYVPLDPTYPQERLAFMLEDAQAPVLLTQQRLVKGLPAHGAQVLCLDADWPEIARACEENPASGVKPADRAYVIYTSGSTGKPKGVQIAHRAAVNFLHAMRQQPGLTEHDVMLAVTTLSFDIALLEVFLPISVGASVVVVSREVASDGKQLQGKLATSGATVMQATPATWRLLLETGWRGSQQLKILCGGEALSWNLANQLRERCASLWNMYGPTETTVWSTVHQVAAGEGPVSIGRPVANTQIYVLDAQLQPVPIGVAGELHIGGDSLARGYLNRPELTAEKFIANPFSDEPQARLYKTGDLARYLPNGDIECLGRLDHQVKIRGFRIELGEIEATLAQHQAVREVVVVVREDVPGDKRLVAYLIPHREQSLTTSELRSFVQEQLPDYMVPSHFVLLDALPLTPNGKVDRKALPAPVQNRPQLKAPYVAPRTELEEFLAKTWREILHVDEIGIHDNFFELGGNSIQGAMFINKVQRELGVFVYIVAVFDSPTIVEFAAYLNSRYRDSMARFSGVDTAGSEKVEVKLDGASTIDEAKIAQIRAFIPSVPPHVQHPEDVRAKNPPAVFILSAPRSGTTLLRVMLAGNPRLFAPPELELLGYDTLEERKAALSGRFSLWLEGTVRAIMDIKGCDAEQAQRIMAHNEDRKLTTKQFYRKMQAWIGNKKLVDKSTTYALDIETLKRAESYFDNALYIYLSRHPHGMIKSFQDVSLDQVFFRHEHPFSTRELAELIWIVCHQNIQAFLEQIPENRQYRLRFEELVNQPQKILKEMCQSMGVECHPDMARPYKDKERKMTDGIHTVSTMLGDMKFHQHKDIDPALAERWKESHAQDSLSDITWQIAEKMGYERPKNSRKLPKDKLVPSNAQALVRIELISRDADTELPLSFSQERLWFLDQLEPDSRAYNIPLVIRLSGSLTVKVLDKSVNAIVRRHESLRSTFQSVAGRPVSVIAPELTLKLPVIGLEALAANEREVEAVRLATEQAEQPFDLARGPLVRVSLLRLDEDEHWLVVTMHHTVTDGWSLGIFRQELAALYKAFSSGQPPTLPELPVQYADYAQWQRQWLQDEVVDTQLAYWKERLGDAPPVLELPTDRPRPARQTFRGAKQSLALPQSLVEALQSLGQQEEATLFMTLLAAFQVQLLRYTGQDDISVGSPVAGRNRIEVEGLIGLFVNTLVLRTDLAGNPSFRELLHRVREVALGAYAHQDLPFEKLVEALQPERSLSHSPLFQVMFALQNMPTHTDEVPGLALRRKLIDIGAATSDLMLFVFPQEEGIRVMLEYNTDLFDAATITRMLEHYHALLEGIVAYPEQCLSELPLLTSAERHKLLVEWNATEADYPKEACLHQLFEAQVELTPDAVAVVFEDDPLSYRELNRRANRLSHHLQALGVGPEVLIGLCMERSVDMMVGLLGILKAGGAYVPLDPEFPQERLAFMLEDAKAPVLVTQQRLVEGLRAHGAHVLCLDTDWPEIADASEENPVTGITPADRAYVIYTSGSTGKPKGVQIPHRAAVNLLHSMSQQPGLTEHDVMLGVTTLSFDLSFPDFFLPLSVGARVVLVSREVASDAKQLQEQLATSGATIMQATPATWRLLLESGWTGNQRLKILCGGEALTRDLANQLRQRCASLWNMYGPTEATVWSTAHQVNAGDGPVCIGRPIANTQVYVLDAQLQPVPIGVAGELHIGGHGLALGYFNRPELTAERFIANPFSEEPQDRLYKTGDLVRYLPTGDIECVGRLDYQVKVRGFRIELGEIESVLTQHPVVRAVVVVVREDVPGDRRLVAYLVPHQEQSLTTSELRRFVQEELPDYMLPSRFVFLDALPLSPNGKVDRRALPVPDQSRQEQEETFVAPRDELELQLTKIWEKVLGIQSIGVRDNFFALGGHSLLAVRLFDQIAKVFGSSPPLFTLLQAPTVEQLADILRQEGCSSIRPTRQKQELQTDGPVSRHGIRRMAFKLLNWRGERA